MSDENKELESLINQIVHLVQPVKIFLFSSKNGGRYRHLMNQKPFFLKADINIK